MRASASAPLVKNISAARFAMRRLLTAISAAAALLVLLDRYRRRKLLSMLRQCKIVVANSGTARAIYSSAIHDLVCCCFPEDIDSDDARSSLEEDPLTVLSGFHDVEDCEWLLAIDESGFPIGLAMAVAYHDSLYVASLCVLPSRRGRGVGGRIMRAASAYAAAKGLPALSGSVMRSREEKASSSSSSRTSSERLVRFYSALGGSVQQNHAVASLNSPPPTLRLRAPSGKVTSRGEPPPTPLPPPPADALSPPPPPPEATVPAERLTFANLPMEMQLLVLACLDAPTSLLQVGLVGRHLRSLSTSEALWEAHCLASLGLGAYQLSADQLRQLHQLGAISYRRLYWQCHPLRPTLMVPGMKRTWWAHMPTAPMPSSLLQRPGAPDWVFVEVRERRAEGRQQRLLRPSGLERERERHCPLRTCMQSRPDEPCLRRAAPPTSPRLASRLYSSVLRCQHQERQVPPGRHEAHLSRRGGRRSDSSRLVTPRLVTPSRQPRPERVPHVACQVPPTARDRVGEWQLQGLDVVPRMENRYAGESGTCTHAHAHAQHAHMRIHATC